MEPVTRTIYSAHLQTCLKAKTPNQAITLIPNSTLNEKFNFLATATIDASELPVDNYVAIGTGGAVYYPTGDNDVRVTQLKHSISHVALYNHIPFIARPVTADLSNVTGIGRYRMRLVGNRNGIDYAFYYLRVLDKTNSVTSVKKRTVVNNSFSSTDFSPSAEDINVTMPNNIALDLANPTAEYLVSTFSVPFVLTTNDLKEISDACTILGGIHMPVVINEMAICSGVDRDNITASGYHYQEVVGCQVSTFVNPMFLATPTTPDKTFTFDLGTMTPITDARYSNVGE